MITKILIDREAGETDFDLNKDIVRQIVLDSLKQNEAIKVKLGGSKTEKAILRVKFRFISNEDGLEKGKLLVNLKYSLPTQKGSKQYTGSGAALVLNNSKPSKIYKEVFLEGMSDLLLSLKGEERSAVRLLNVVEGYAAGDLVAENYLLQSIYLLGVKKEKRATKALCKILLSQNEKAAMASLLALTNIADPSSLDAITQYAERKNSEVRKQAILAVRQIGGQKAAAWLFTMSTGYVDPEVCLAASEALKVVESKLKTD